MNIFILGLPKSGRSTIAQAVAVGIKGQHIDATGWVKNAFRERKYKEHLQHYEDEFNHFLSIRRTINPTFISQHVRDTIKSYDSDTTFVIDGVNSPKDFATLFDYRDDVVVFLNRTDNETEHKDHETIGISVMRDYCFWMSSASLLKKDRWIEYNFKIPGEPSDQIKTLGSKNSVFIIKSVDKVIEHLLEQLQPLVRK
jgi:adenylate kinase family enzyme